MPRHVVELIISSLNDYQKSINGSNILIIGIAYKKDINDCRESPALDIIQILKDQGSDISYFDPFVPSLEFGEFNFKSIKSLDESTLAKFDASVIVTDHSNIDYKSIYTFSDLIIDTRNVYKNYSSKNKKTWTHTLLIFNNKNKTRILLF